MNSPLVFCPIEHHLGSMDDINTSNHRIRDMVQGEMKDELALTGIFIWADARDVADAHVCAMELPQAAGRRFLCAAGHFSNSDIANAIAKNFPDLKAKLAVSYDSDLDLEHKPYEFNNSPSIDILGIEYRSIEESIVDTVKSLQKIGIKELQ